jgi:hypothetical protein
LEAIFRRAGILAHQVNLEGAATEPKLAINLEPQIVVLWVMQAQLLYNLRQTSVAGASADQDCVLGDFELMDRLCEGAQ